MFKRRAAIAAAVALISFSMPFLASAQGYGGGDNRDGGYRDGDHRDGGYRDGDRRDGGDRDGGYGSYGRLPMFRVNQWSEQEDGGWTGTWTFEGSRRSMSAVWTNQNTGRHRRASGMSVRRAGEQIIINRPGLGNYVGTISPDGTSISGTLSWSPGHFTARAIR